MKLIISAVVIIICNSCTYNNKNTFPETMTKRDSILTDCYNNYKPVPDSLKKYFREED